MMVGEYDLVDFGIEASGYTISLALPETNLFARTDRPKRYSKRRRIQRCLHSVYPILFDTVACIRQP